MNKEFFLVCLLPAFSIILFILLMHRQLTYHWQAEITKESGTTRVDYRILDENCIEILKAENTVNTPYIYCGKYILRNYEISN